MKTELELAEILDRCLERVRAGAPVADVLAQYPEDAEQLRPLKVATLLPTETLGLFGVPDLAPVAQEVEKEIKAMMDEAVAA